MSDLSERIAARVVTPWPDCMIWTGATDRGYGRLWVGGKRGRAARVHRLAWELWRGPIPDGLEIDHLCRIRACVNVAHMELVEHPENMRRMFASDNHALRSAPEARPA